MVELSRRSFLGGSITVLAAVTFVPKPSIAGLFGNTPTIWGDGFHDDTAGIGALLRSEPVISPKELIGIESNGGIIFHHGTYLINQTIEIPEEANLTIERMWLRAGKDLREHNAPLFRTEARKHVLTFTNNRGIQFRSLEHHVNLFRFQDPKTEEYMSTSRESFNGH